MNKPECACGRPLAGPKLCSRCTLTFEHAIVNVAAYYLDLETVATRQTRYGSVGATKGSIGKEQPLPVDPRFVVAKNGGAILAPGALLRSEVEWTVRRYATELLRAYPPIDDQGQACSDRYCLHADCAEIRRRRAPEDTVASRTRYLARMFRYVEAADWAVEAFERFLDLERRLARLVDRPADRWYAGKCSIDDCPAELYARTDKGTIKCPACGTTHDVASRRDFLLAEAKEYLVTAKEAASALIAWTDYDGTEKKLVDRIAYWRDTGRLEVVSTTTLYGHERDLYRLGDVQDRLIDSAQRRQAARIGSK